MYVVSMDNSCVVPILKHVNRRRIFDVKLQRATFKDIHRKVKWKSVTSLFQSSFHIIESHLHFMSHLAVFLYCMFHLTSMLCLLVSFLFDFSGV